MKILFYLLVLVLPQFLLGQDFYLHLEGQNEEETKIITLLEYEKKHKSVALLLENQEQFYKKLVYSGYIDAALLSQKKTNDSSFVMRYALGVQLKYCKISCKKLNPVTRQLLAISQDTITLPTTELVQFLEKNLSNLEKNGYLLASLQLATLKKERDYLSATLEVELNQPRTLSGIEIIGYPTFPVGVRKAIFRNARKKVFNQANLDEIQQAFGKLLFVNQLKYPEILFTKDSTKVFVYLEKSKPNRFDGYIGFSNDKAQKLVFNGYLDLQLQNILNKGEYLNLYWKNDGNKQTTFQLGAELPYLMRSPLGIKTNLRLFKQDSLFQNTQLDLHLGYYFSYNTKLFAGLQQTTSVAIQKTNTLNVYDFSNSFITSSFDYLNPNLDSYLFREKTKIKAKIGFGSRTHLGKKEGQYFGQLEWSHHFQWGSRHSIMLKQHNYYLHSSTYISNELYRFGGIHSLRGFSENSLQANFFSGLMTEYRYLVASNLYVHSVFDYGIQQDKSTKLNTQLRGIGFGFGLLTKNVMLHFVYANGGNYEKFNNLNNSVVQISVNTKF